MAMNNDDHAKRNESLLYYHDEDQVGELSEIAVFSKSFDQGGDILLGIGS